MLTIDIRDPMARVAFEAYGSPREYKPFPWYLRLLLDLDRLWIEHCNQKGRWLVDDVQVRP